MFWYQHKTIWILAEPRKRARLQMRRLRDQRGKERQHECADQRNHRHPLMVRLLTGHRVRCVSSSLSDSAIHRRWRCRCCGGLVTNHPDEVGNVVRIVDQCQLGGGRFQAVIQFAQLPLAILQGDRCPIPAR